MAPITSIVVMGAPLPTMMEIRRSQSVGCLPLLPYTAMSINAFSWIIYGLLKENINVWGTNLFGLIFSLYYMAEYCRFHSNPVVMNRHVQLTMITMMLITALAIILPKTTAEKIIGTASVFFLYYYVRGSFGYYKTSNTDKICTVYSSLFHGCMPRELFSLDILWNGY
uniref:Sugar transporter SWEET1 n=1 Tax=Corethron hystrix TaxID=216773 RepID=A0A7S1BTV2_9STRA